VNGIVQRVKDRAERSPRLFRLLAGLRDAALRWRRRLLLPFQLLRRPFQVRAYLKGAREPRLNVGCGPNPEPGWLNCDLKPQGSGVVYLDASLPFPFPSGVFRFVYSEHLIEHLDRRGAAVFLREAFRVLRPGGAIRVATPDLGKYVSYCAGRNPEMDAYAAWIGKRYLKDPEATPAQVLNNLFRNFGHRHLFDSATLTKFLRAAGFQDIAEAAVGESRIEVFRGLERHGTSIPEEFNRLETLVLEARKPEGRV